MRSRWCAIFGLLLFASPLTAAVPRILLVARDLEEHPLPGLVFAYSGAKSLKTNSTGATELDLPSAHEEGRPVKIQLLPGSNKGDDWFLVNPQINIPTASAPAELVLMRRSTFRKLADAAVAAAPARSSIEPSAEERKRILVETAARYGLKADQLETALRSFAETQDLKDRGIAAYLEGQYPNAEDLLQDASIKQESDLVETLRYLGATQYEQAKYHAAAANFRKALSLRPEEASSLKWLGITLHALAEWSEAERLIRRSLAVEEKSCGPESPEVASSLNSLALLLQEVNRRAEAEPLMRRSLGIFERTYGPESPEVAGTLKNLAFLLQETNRLAGAEPLMRRSLAIFEERYGPESPEVASSLNGLALLYFSASRFADAEPLIRRALAIDEKILGPNHPDVGRDLNSLASLLEVTNRFTEAEQLMMRALTIFESRFGENHSKVSSALNNLAILFQSTKRFSQAESLLRRALEIDEMRYGLDHPEVATDLNNLAQLFQTMNRIAEAEFVMRRVLTILLKFGHCGGHEHPHLLEALISYTYLLERLCRTPAEIEEAIRAMGANSSTCGLTESRTP